MGRTRIVKVENPSVSLKSVVPIMPKDEKEKRQLAEDLIQMGCEGLIIQPWALKSEAMM